MEAARRLGNRNGCAPILSFAVARAIQRRKPEEARPDAGSEQLEQSGDGIADMYIIDDVRVECFDRLILEI